MNKGSSATRIQNLLHRAMLAARLVPHRRRCGAFGGRSSGGPAIERILVINLDREHRRRAQMERELERLRDSSGRSLHLRARWLAAVDARLLDDAVIRDAEVETCYALADQLAVDPEPLLDVDTVRDVRIEMTRQEVAVALSHIRAWKTIADSDAQFTLVVEDDVVPVFEFARALDRAWWSAHRNRRDGAGFDVLYLSYKAVGAAAPLVGTGPVLSPPPGLWELSGYVLSQAGARRLLGMLPVCGPVDLWVNHQFERLDVLAVGSPVLQQRRDVPSTNAYSVVPILTKLGVISDAKPHLPKPARLPTPVFGTGQAGSGLTALATALSMLEYRCCSDWCDLPASEQSALDRGSRRRRFDAYVNITSLNADDLRELGRIYPRAKFVVCTPPAGGPAPCGVDDVAGLAGDLGSDRVLHLPLDHPDKWEALCAFLDIAYPDSRYPAQPDLGARPLRAEPPTRPATSYRHSNRQRVDATPWVVPDPNWPGLHADGQPRVDEVQSFVDDDFRRLDPVIWKARQDTFPSNLAIFTAGNVTAGTATGAQLTLTSTGTAVRDFSAGAIATTQRFRYGRFSAQVRPARVPGLITGIFLHRDLPRQEIDIEFLGRDTTRMLVNVYYNPGTAGARMQFGYRGAPSLIDLGFDAADDFHLYEIEWCPSVIRWLVDGRVVQERGVWNPTPIPNRPLEFNINLWHSRSRELAGRLDPRELPARSHIRAARIAAVEIHTAPDPSRLGQGRRPDAEWPRHPPRPATDLRPPLDRGDALR